MDANSAKQIITTILDPAVPNGMEKGSNRPAFYRITRVAEGFRAERTSELTGQGVVIDRIEEALRLFAPSSKFVKRYFYNCA